MKPKKIRPIAASEHSEKPVALSDVIEAPLMRITDDPFGMRGDGHVELTAPRIALFLPDGTRWEFYVSPNDGALEVYACPSVGGGKHQIHVIPKTSNTLAMVLK